MNPVDKSRLERGRSHRGSILRVAQPVRAFFLGDCGVPMVSVYIYIYFPYSFDENQIIWSEILCANIYIYIYIYTETMGTPQSHKKKALTG